jgi:alanine racemase
MREAIIDLAAIDANIRTIAALVDPARVLMVVKADAYGHGAVPVARAAVDAGAAWLGVVDLAEARVLRDAGVPGPILAWIHPSDTDFAWGVEAGIELGIGSNEVLEAAGAATGRAVVHLKVDTGLGRGGAIGDDWLALVARAAQLQSAGRIEVRGVFSHLANAGWSADDDQLARFDDAIDAARDAGLDPEVEHIAASEAIVTRRDSHRSLVRVGLAAYGLSPVEGRSAADLGLRPAMELATEVVAVKRVPAGHGVSYGHTYRTSRETTLVLLPLGYGDGVPRHASGLGPVSLGGRRFEVAGRIAMDQMVVDVGDVPVAVGDRAVLFGDPATGVPSADDWALAADTISYEIVTRVGPRVPRRYRG